MDNKDINSINTAFNKRLSSFYSGEKSMKVLFDKVENMQKSLFSFPALTIPENSMIKELSKSVKIASELSTKHFDNLIPAASQVLKYQNDIFSKLSRSIKPLVDFDFTKNIMKAHESAFSMVNKAIPHFSEINNLSKSLIEANRSWEKSFSEISSKLKINFEIPNIDLINKISSTINFDNIDVSDDGSLMIDDEVVACAELKGYNEISQLVSEVKSGNSSLSKKIDKMKSPLIFILLVGLLINFISDNINPIINKSLKPIKNIIKTEYKKVIKEIRNKSNNNSVISENETMIVTKDCLNLYKKRSTNSTVINKVYFGTFVILVNKKRNWSHIAYQDEDGIFYKGWVYSRYLHKFI